MARFRLGSEMKGGGRYWEEGQKRRCRVLWEGGRRRGSMCGRSAWGGGKKKGLGGDGRGSARR